MYAAHFGLTERPFSLAPDPRYLYLSDAHREALPHLLYGVGGGGSVVQLMGEVGTGKTTVCRALLEQVPPDVDVAMIFNPRLTSVELLAVVCDELRVAYPAGTTSLKVLVDALSQALLEAHGRGRRTVLIIDEAQNLSAEVLEEVRQQPDLLEHLGAEVLRLVDDQHGPPPAPVRLEERLGERIDQDLEARRACRIGHAELVAHDREQLDRRQPGIEDHGDIDVGRHLLEQGAAHGGLPRTDLARELHDASPAPDPVEQMGEGLTVRVAQIEVARIGREGKRPLGESEVGGIHGVTHVEARERWGPRQGRRVSLARVSGRPCHRGEP